jgi:hypothetical protein
MLRGIIKVDPKKDVCHSVLVIEILMQHFSPKTEKQRPLEATLAQA